MCLLLWETHTSCHRRKDVDTQYRDHDHPLTATVMCYHQVKPLLLLTLAVTFFQPGSRSQQG